MPLGYKHTKETKEKISKIHKGKTIPKEMRERVSIALSREKSPFWKGGKLTRGLGYVYIYMPGHPNATAYKGKYIAEHRFVMANKIGRPLRNDEIVHHINGKKDDNRIENLELLTNKTHHSGHIEECPKCGFKL